MEPVRTCVGCRTRAPRATLLRVVSQGDILIIDEGAVLPGRGAWLHPTRECMEAALRRRAFGRALRVSATVDTQTIEQYPFRNKG
ncbi:MAG: YlxR family protein [Microbacterium sp.]|uniref:YlxR family protein n=1 Tax=Microbacterium sp. TaxID=51671 RepID=UPI001D5EA655|nr:YlxR family protein [Microbacterium sp.]MBW8761856.1 YlxR family protein [Microbacterium sp.]